ncbi:GMC family oxidoreductase [Shewanella sp. 202IG2-18]|uniref:GMC family oxidoreductase n=1 Tax=Parashewanella hymeniacidonis TaxID=2807618 RepID=UPI0019601E08|nr:GMC family oxidoreductase [Parashewanella hymeniacidonis]
MMMVDPIETGLENGWKHIDASQLNNDQYLETDVVIVGTGAGGGIAAEQLTKAGHKVIMLEAGSLRSSSEFDMEERTAYPNLYQQAAAMKTNDSTIGIFQGRTVGGSTTINWTTSIRTPELTLKYWGENYGIKEISPSELKPWFEEAEQRLNIKQWPVPPNPNNQSLLDGCNQLQWQHTVIKRNVKGCWNLGYCGMGCPTNAKQSMLVTTVPSALNRGATLITNAKAINLQHSKRTVLGLDAVALNQMKQPTGHKIHIVAKRYILATGAIHTPVLLMRSNTPDPYHLLGKRTFLHPVLLSGALFDKAINGHSGAPQSIYSDEFLWRDGVEGELGYKLEVPPIHPLLVASKTLGFGKSHAELMRDLNQLQVTIALIRDGFNSESQGGEVKLTRNSFEIDYPLTDTFWRAARASFVSMAELQFAAGAQKVLPINDGMSYLNSWSQAKSSIETMSLAKLKTVIASAHVMGGCPMGEKLETSMVNSYGQHHYLDNLSVMDGSVFPTSVGANPQLSIYGMAMRNCSSLSL